MAGRQECCWHCGFHFCSTELLACVPLLFNCIDYILLWEKRYHPHVSYKGDLWGEFPA